MLHYLGYQVAPHISNMYQVVPDPLLLSIEIRNRHNKALQKHYQRKVVLILVKYQCMSPREEKTNGNGLTSWIWWGELKHFGGSQVLGCSFRLSYPNVPRIYPPAIYCLLAHPFSLKVAIYLAFQQLLKKMPTEVHFLLSRKSPHMKLSTFCFAQLMPFSWWILQKKY